MNPTSTDPTAPPPPPQPPRSSFSCDRHPSEQFTGFCPSCLCERLTSLDNSTSNTPSTSRRPSSASAAASTIKSLFSSNPKPPIPKPSRPASFFPELRRSKSFSASKNEALGLNFEPQRKSCDVRGRNTLWSLFTLEDENKTSAGDDKPSSIVASAASSSHQNPQTSTKTGNSVADKPVFEETENEEDFKDPENVDDGAVCDGSNDSRVDEIRSVKESHLENSRNAVEFAVNCGEIVEEEAVSVSNLRIKDHIDIDLDNTQEKKSSGGGFWAAASVFSMKWRGWRLKQKTKKQNNGGGFTTLPVEKPISRHYRETQSEIADYGFGRRSCDTGPRFSLDAGRISFDDARYSFDEARASWDGYMIGRSSTRMAPMVSVMEDGPSLPVSRTDMKIPVEEISGKCVDEGEGVPGGSLQTKEYYLGSSSRRRKSLDRSSSIRKMGAVVVAEIDELKVGSHSKVSPTTTDCIHLERELRDTHSQSLRDDGSETFELGSGCRDSSNSLIGNGDRKETKKSRGWSWRIRGFIQRINGGNKDEDGEEKYSRVNGVQRSLSESLQHSRTEGNGDVRGLLNGNMFRSNSSVSWRNSNHISGSFRSMRKSGGNGKKRRDEFVLEKNRSGRYSPNHVGNGPLRFHSTPLPGSQRGGMDKTKADNSHSIARSVLRLF